MTEMTKRVALAMLEHLRHRTDVSSHSDGTENVGLEDAWISLDQLAEVAITTIRESLAEKFFVVRDPSATAPWSEIDQEEIWTVSQDPNHTGWNTDSGYPGYGLTKAQAEYLALGANLLASIDAALAKDAP